jgi:chromosome segregation ATPase
LQLIKNRLSSLPKQASTDALRNKQARLEGVLRWQLHSQYKPRLWQAKRTLGELEQLLDESQLALNSLRDARSDTPDEFGTFKQRIATQRENIQALLARTQGVHQAQGELIEQLAVNELEQQKERIDAYIVQARFSLAQTYDSALQAGHGETQ